MWVLGVHPRSPLRLLGDGLTVGRGQSRKVVKGMMGSLAKLVRLVGSMVRRLMLAMEHLFIEVALVEWSEGLKGLWRFPRCQHGDAWGRDARFHATPMKEYYPEMVCLL